VGVSKHDRVFDREDGVVEKQAGDLLAIRPMAKWPPGKKKNSSINGKNCNKKTLLLEIKLSLLGCGKGGLC